MFEGWNLYALQLVNFWCVSDLRIFNALSLITQASERERRKHIFTIFPRGVPLTHIDHFYAIPLSSLFMALSEILCNNSIWPFTTQHGVSLLNVNLYQFTTQSLVDRESAIKIYRKDCKEIKILLQAVKKYFFLPILQRQKRDLKIKLDLEMTLALFFISSGVDFYGVLCSHSAVRCYC